MDRISTASSYSAIIAALQQQQVRQTQAGEQVSTGKTADDLAGYASSASQITAAQTLIARTDAYVATGKSVQNRLDAQNLALNQVSDAASGAREAVADAVANGTGASLMTALNGFFGEAASGLNTQYVGSYLFSGGASDQPVATTEMSGLTAPGATVFQNGTFVQTAQVDDSTVLSTGVLADHAGGSLVDVFKSIQSYVDTNGPFGEPLTEDQSNFLTSTLSSFDSAQSGLTDTIASNGANQARADDVVTAQTDKQTSLQGVLGDLTDVDAADAASRLTQAQTAVQAAAQVFSILKSSTLLNYLS